MQDSQNNNIRPWARVVILVISLVAALTISYFSFGSLIPKNAKDALIFQNALLLIVLGSAILEFKFTKPADSLVNSLIGIVTLVTVYNIAPFIPWLLVFLYCCLVLIASTICVAVSTGPKTKGWQKTTANITYQISVLLGKARLLFSIIFLFGLLSFYELQSAQTILFILFWGAYMAIWPLGIPELLSRIEKTKKTALNPIGSVLRTDSPNIVRVGIEPKVKWHHSSPKIYIQVDGKQKLLLPLYSQLQEENLLGTGICIKEVSYNLAGCQNGLIYEHPQPEDYNEGTITKHLSGNETSKLIGFTIENSSIEQIIFETFDIDDCKAGMLVWCKIGDEKVYYQITNGFTREETLHTDRHGYQTATATQLGILNKDKGFIKFDWLPHMNSPVFSEPDDYGTELLTLKENDFSYGVLPHTNINIGGPFCDSITEHIALLGITGSGKTELAFDLIRHSLEQNIKVICIDLTSQYENRLSDLNPEDLSLDDVRTKELSERLFAAETGAYGAGAEKQVLKEFSEGLRTYIKNRIEKFIDPKESTKNIGVISLNEISNTKATLFITEIYLTCLLNYAKQNVEKNPKIMIVVEEAHTVMPEPSTMGLSDYDSRGVVSKIAQIALQGRKYGVGLLVIAQRTATVSKSILTQCNSIISFSCYDDTSLGFLSNILGSGYTNLIPNLPQLHAIIYGKIVKSDRPIIAAIPFDIKKSNNK